MKTFSLIAGLIVTAAFSASAAEVTLEGKATCNKCELKKSAKCEDVLVVTKDGKSITYLLEGKGVQGFHKEICSEGKKAKAVGTVAEKDGKHTMTVTKIEIVKS